MIARLLTFIGTAIGDILGDEVGQSVNDARREVPYSQRHGAPRSELQRINNALHKKILEVLAERNESDAIADESLERELSLRTSIEALEACLREAPFVNTVRGGQISTISDDAKRWLAQRDALLCQQPAAKEENITVVSDDDHSVECRVHRIVNGGPCRCIDARGEP